MTYFEEKTFNLSEGPFIKFVPQEIKKIKTPQNKEKCLFLKQSYIYFANPNYKKHSNFPKFCQNHWTLLYIQFITELHKENFKEGRPVQREN
jgi:hypothetical protein